MTSKTLHAISLAARERAGAILVPLLLLLPRIVLRALERCGVRSVGWALTAIAIACPPPRRTEASGVHALQTRKAAALARRAELAALEQQLIDARDDVERVRLLEQLAQLTDHVPPASAVLLLALFGACAPSADSGARDVRDPACLDNCDAAQLVERDAEVRLDEDLEGLEGLEGLEVLTLDYRHCRGAWADRDDSSTRYTPHPETGLCTFACSWQDARCDAQWFSDARCLPPHADRLEALCAELGGSCRRALTSDVLYCEAQ